MVSPSRTQSDYSIIAVRRRPFNRRLHGRLAPHDAQPLSHLDASAGPLVSGSRAGPYWGVSRRISRSSWRASRGRTAEPLEVRNPFDGSVVGRTWLAGDAEFDEAAAAAVGAAARHARRCPRTSGPPSSRAASAELKARRDEIGRTRSRRSRQAHQGRARPRSIARDDLRGRRRGSPHGSAAR